MKYSKLAIALYLSFCASWAKSFDATLWSGDEKKIVFSFLKLHEKFSKKTCSEGEDHRYKKLLKGYKGEGFYVPVVGETVDFMAIQRNLSVLEKKIKWIKDEVSKLEKKKKLPEFSRLAKPLNERLLKLVELKKAYQFSVNEKDKSKYLKKSRKELEKLTDDFDDMIGQISFLSNSHFPVDHLMNRALYEKYKQRATKADTLKANDIYLRRKILEDGAFEPDHSRGDKFFRSTLDTLSINIRKQKDFLSETIHYDLEWSLNVLEKHLRRGRKAHLVRLGEWQKRTEKKLKFYNDLIVLNQTQGGQQKLREIVKKKKKATNQLESFVIHKQAEVYQFWLRQSLQMRALFVLDVILMNEAGDVDGRLGNERSDIAQVVINRLDNSEYNSLSEDQALYKKLSQSLEPKKIQNNKWLNVLFREGEFSFTYYFIPSVSKVFCPDMSRYGRFLRKENLHLAIKRMVDLDDRFNAVRYFSRASMVGKIDMASIWQGFEALAERPGPRHKKSDSYRELYLKGDFTYLYSFVDPEQRLHQVVRFDNNEPVVVHWSSGQPNFFYYRNPHHFTYFYQNQSNQH